MQMFYIFNICDYFLSQQHVWLLGANIKTTQTLNYENIIPLPKTNAITFLFSQLSFYIYWLAADVKSQDTIAQPRLAFRNIINPNLIPGVVTRKACPKWQGA